jgi:hypothetical protein
MMNLTIIRGSSQGKCRSKPDFRFKIIENGPSKPYRSGIELRVLEGSSGVEPYILLFTHVGLSACLMEQRHRNEHNEKTHEVDFTLQPMRLNLLQKIRD